MNTRTSITIAVAATALIVAPVTAFTVATLTPERVVTVTHTVPQVVEDTTAITAYGDAVKALRDASGKGEDLLPYLIELAEVDNSIRLTTTR